MNVFGPLLTLLLAEKSGLGLTEKGVGTETLDKFTEELTKRLNQAPGDGGEKATARAC